jgi:hypothetical protein
MKPVSPETHVEGIAGNNVADSLFHCIVRQRCLQLTIQLALALLQLRIRRI